MASFYRELPPQAFSAGNNTGNTLDLKALAANMDRGVVYVRSILFNFVGSVTSTAGGAANLSRIIANINHKIPEVAEPINVSGNGSARLFRVENKGEFPPFTLPATSIAWTGVGALAAGANAVDMTWVHDFARDGARRYDDGAFPLRLLQAGVLKVTWGALLDIIADCTALTGTLTVTLELCRKPELRAPQFSVVDELDVTGAMPPIQPVDGKIVTLLLRPTDMGVFPNATDYATLGLGFDDYKITEDGVGIGAFYRSFNRIATTDFQLHTSTRTDRTVSVPFVFPPSGKQGQHITFEAIPSGGTPRVKAGAAVQAYTYIRRYVLDNRSPAMRKVRAILGIPEGKWKAQTASHKPTSSPEVEAFLPQKAT